MRLNEGRLEALLPLGRCSCSAAIFLATSALAGRPAGVDAIAVMSDCKGAFGGAYEADVGGAHRRVLRSSPVRRRRTRRSRSPGITGAQAGGKTIQVVGYGCGDDTPAIRPEGDPAARCSRLKRRRDGWPAVRRRGRRGRELGEGTPKKTVIIGTAGSQDPTLQIAPKNVFRLPRRRCAVERRHR